MPEDIMKQEISPIHRERAPIVEQIADLARERYVQAIAGGIWAVNAGYNFFVEKQDALTSVLHGITNPANTPLFTPQFQGEIGKIGAVSQEAMYFVVAGAAVGATSVVLDNRTKWREGRGTITKKNSVILADCEGLPLLVDLGQQLSTEGQLGNVVLSKTAESPERTTTEQGIFKVWVANAGGAEKDFFDTSFWKRSGAKDANAIVLNSSNITSSTEAAVVIREQLGNEKAAIVIISSNPDNLPKSERDERTKAYIVNPYSELATRSIDALVAANEDFFIPVVNESATLQEYKNSVDKKRASLVQKLTALSNRSDKIRIFLNGDLEGIEGRGLLGALRKQDQVEITTDPQNTDIAYYFGSGEITDDSSVMVEDENDPFKNNDKVIKLRIPFDRDNEDNALGHGDGTISFERATNAKLTEILKPHVEYQLSLKDRLSRVLRKGIGRKIRQQVAS
jgi:hypothetical protein